MTRLNYVELALMNNVVRRAAQKWVELRAFERMLGRAGIDLTGARILDAGCGSGNGLRLLSDRFRPRRLVGIDLMPEQIERARALGLPAELRIGDLGAIDEPDGAFDAVFVFGILHHIPAWRAVLRELARVVAPGGVLLVDELHGRTARFFDAVIRTEHPREAFFDWPTFELGLGDAGFEILDRHEFASGAFASFLCRKGPTGT